MTKLHGWREILTYLGYSRRNRRAVARVRKRYGEAIMRDRETGRVWALEEQLHAIDVRRSAAISAGPVKTRIIDAFGTPLGRPLKNRA